MFKQLFLPLIVAFLFIAVVGLFVQGKIGNIKQANKNYIKIDEIKIEVELAKTDEERKKGLSGRENLAENKGMLFILPDNSKPSFWMKDTLIPLDIIWIDDQKIIGIDKNISVEKGVLDSNLKIYSAPSAVDYVLEVNAGFSDKNNIKIGSTFQTLFDL